MASPPPLQRDKCRATCLRRACDVLTPEDRQRDAPPPPPPSPHPPKKGARTARRQRGDMGGGKGRTETPGGETRGEQKKTKQKQTKNKGHQHARAGADSRGRRDMAGARKHGKGRRKEGRPWGRKLGGRHQRRSKRGGGGDKSPQKTLVKYPTSGVWPPPLVSVSAPPERRQ